MHIGKTIGNQCKTSQSGPGGTPGPHGKATGAGGGEGLCTVQKEQRSDGQTNHVQAAGGADSDHNTSALNKFSYPKKKVKNVFLDSLYVT